MEKKMGLIEDRRMAWRGALKGTGRSVGHVGQYAESKFGSRYLQSTSDGQGILIIALLIQSFLELYMRGIFN